MGIFVSIENEKDFLSLVLLGIKVYNVIRLKNVMAEFDELYINTNCI